MWETATREIVEVARRELGTTKPSRWKMDRPAWLWTGEVKMKVRKKDGMYYVFLRNKKKWQHAAVAMYTEAKKATTKAVAAEKAALQGRQ